MPSTLTEKTSTSTLSRTQARKFFLFGAVGLLILALDQATKAWVLHAMPLYSQKKIIPGFFNLVHVRNTGVAFSIFAGTENPWRVPVLAALTVVALAVIFFLYRESRPEERVKRVALSLIAGGALGNLVDRVRFGNVVDFLDFYIGPYHWPAFNVADMAVTVGAALLGVSLLRGEKPPWSHP
ncbi:signal peptidase II [Desulfosoma caldarium]|uniref:Lipoprotein signal peptidase n=1 Tax=Desulfosoma caldarium TaxID=610254 RepID=A0A3N1VGE8_9BACT|nr:signal peptidase II [Desulfosoma caldarium]ROR01945.1 signal peptidase II [Desulfosoma caldarium]